MKSKITNIYVTGKKHAYHCSIFSQTIQNVYNLSAPWCSPLKIVLSTIKVNYVLDINYITFLFITNNHLSRCQIIKRSLLDITV